MSFIQNSLLTPGDKRAANQNISAVDLQIPIRIRYVGTAETGTVQVIATSADLHFFEGPVGSTVADASVLEAGGTAGQIDISDANANTWGKVVDIINGDPNWQAVLIDARRSDVPGAADIATLAETDAKVKDGLALTWDSSAAATLAGSVLVAPKAFRDSIQPYLFNDVNSGTMRANPARLFAGFRTALEYFGVQLDDSVIGNVEVYAEKFTSLEADAASTNTTLFANLLVDATREAHDFRAAPIVSDKGERMLFRAIGGGDFTAIVAEINAYFERVLA